MAMMLHLPSRPLAGLDAAIGLALLRLRLPRLVERSDLPGLLARLSSRRPGVDPATVVRGIDRAEALLSRVDRGATCLHRALARYAVLRRAGLSPGFRLGVRGEADLVGHAWVELDGAPFREPEPPRYAVTFAWPPPDPAGRGAR
jgi:hypothetical protein